MRWLIQPNARVEVWAGAEYLGTLTGMALSLIVHHHLASAQLAAHVQHELASPEPPRYPPRKIITPDAKAELRAKRRADRKRRSK